MSAACMCLHIFPVDVVLLEAKISASGKPYPRAIYEAHTARVYYMYAIPHLLPP